MSYDDDRYESAIARRNILWALWQTKRDAWVSAGSLPGVQLAAVNEAQDAYEWAVRDLVRVRVWRRIHSDIEQAA